MLLRGKIILAVKLQMDIEMFFLQHVIRGCLQNLKHILQTHGFFVIILINRLFDSLDNPDVVLFDLMNVPGNLQSHLLHLRGQIHGENLLIQAVRIAHDPLNLLRILVHQIDFTF